MRVGLVMGSALLMLFLAACGGGEARIFEDFPVPEQDEVTDEVLELLPEVLRTEDLLMTWAVEEREDGLLRLIVEQPGRNQDGILWLNLDEAQGDAAFSVRANIHAGQMRLWLRTNENLCSGYVLTIDPTLDRYRLSVTEPDCSLRTLEDRRRMNVDLDTWYEVTIEGRGSTISGTVDSVRFFEVTDETYTSGSIALQVYTDGIAPGQIELDWLRLD